MPAKRVLIYAKFKKMKQLIYLPFLLVCISCNCNRVNDKINKVGEVVGEAGGQLAKGIGNDATKAFDMKLDLSNSLTEKGLSFGKTTVTDDSIGTDNLLSTYLIFGKDFSGQLTAKVFDNKKQEMGRTIATVVGKSGDAKYIDFHFDKRTNIDNDCKITIEEK